jgi:hypothetical protein
MQRQLKASTWIRALRLLPCWLLVVVALHQLLLVHARDLSPWLGGGFGMFSTTDVGSARHVHVYLLRPGLEREVRVQPQQEPIEIRALALPSDPNLEKLALSLARTPTPDHGPAQAVRVQLWKTRYDPETLLASGVIVRELDVPLSDD